MLQSIALGLSTALLPSIALRLGAALILSNTRAQSIAFGHGSGTERCSDNEHALVQGIALGLSIALNLSTAWD